MSLRRAAGRPVVLSALISSVASGVVRAEPVQAPERPDAEAIRASDGPAAAVITTAAVTTDAQPVDGGSFDARPKSADSGEGLVEPPAPLTEVDGSAGDVPEESSATVAPVQADPLDKPLDKPPEVPLERPPAPDAETTSRAQPAGPVVRVERSAEGARIVVDGKPFFVRGLNWDEVPVGRNYAWSVWERPDDEVVRLLDRDMALLREMGVNALRVYAGMPARWVRYIHEKWGIYTVINHAAGRYGLTVDGAWQPVTDYADPRVRQQLKEDVARTVASYRGTPGLLMWLLGNENNYGLAWESAAIADLPEERRQDARAEALYSLMGELIDTVKAADPDGPPVAIANGDLQYLDLIARHCPRLDVLGANVYRGRSAGDLFRRVRETLNIPFVFTEFGADAYDARQHREDELTQASYLRDQWRELSTEVAGLGRSGVAAGGFVFQWADGWWKHLQESRLDIHDTHASWANGGYPEDLAPGENNMNEEWWGIMARGKARPGEPSPLHPRAAYFLLKEGFALDPYQPGRTAAEVARHWATLEPRAAARTAASERAALGSLEPSWARLAGSALELATFTTGGAGLATPEREGVRFGQTQWARLGMELQPAHNVTARASVHVTGAVAANPIDEIFYERRGPATLRLYQASLEWSERWFDLEAFHRTGHYHWGYEGDFFGLYPEANDPRGVDTFDAAAPSGMVVTGKGPLDGWKLAVGPELYWGANPGFVLKHHRQQGSLAWSMIYQQDISPAGSSGTSSRIPQPPTGRATAWGAWRSGPLRLELGAIAAGFDRVGRTFQWAEPTSGPSYLDSGYRVLDDQVRWFDTLGAKGRATLSAGRLNLYVQGAWRGLVADSLPEQVLNLAGFRLRESGQGNHAHLLSGATLALTPSLVLAPSVLLQKPLAGPLPVIADRFDAASGTYFGGVTPRNQRDDPFWVRSNREMAAGELLLVYDPTPATWFWQWDNAEREDAPLAACLDLTYRHQPTSLDAALGVTADGTVFAFPGATPAQDLWELWARFVANGGGARLVGTGWLGTGQANGSDGRLVTRGGVEARLDISRLVLAASARWQDWGPYDYHRDYNLTFPLQLAGEAAWTLDTPRWFVADSARVGVAAKYRQLDGYSARVARPLASDASGEEWEVRSYVRVSL